MSWHQPQGEADGGGWHQLCLQTLFTCLESCGPPGGWEALPGYRADVFLYLVWLTPLFSASLCGITSGVGVIPSLFSLSGASGPQAECFCLQHPGLVWADVLVTGNDI